MYYSTSTITVRIAPQAGNQQGGTPVLVSGPCFEEDERISCIFDGIVVEGIYLNQDTTLCISPQLPSTGRFPFRISIAATNGTIRFQGDSVFFSCKPIQTYK